MDDNFPYDDDASHRLFQVADRQSGYFTSADAETVGFSYPMQNYYRAQGKWLHVGWGLYRLRDYPHTDDEELVRLSLWSRDKKGKPQAVVSHDTALSLYGVTDLLPNMIHLTVPKTFRKASPEGVILHKGVLKKADSRVQGAFRITTPLRTLIDFATSAASPEHLQIAVVEAIAQGLLRRAALNDALPALPEHTRSRLERALNVSS